MSEDVREALAMAHEAKEKSLIAAAKIESHEIICSERYHAIREDIKGIYSRIWGAAGIAFIILIGMCSWLYVTLDNDRQEFQQLIIETQKVDKPKGE